MHFTYLSWSPACGKGTYELGSVSQSVRQSVSQSVSDALFSELVHYFFLIFFMKLGVHKRSKVTQPDFLGKLLKSLKSLKMA